MYKKVIEFTDYLGNQRKEDFYFNLNKAELFKWLTTKGDYTLDKLLVRLTKERNIKELMEIFDRLVLESYGKPSLDGRRFDKNEEILNDFKHTEAYSELFMELVSDAEAAANFINGILPKDLSDAIEKILKDNPDGVPDIVKDYLPNLAPETKS